MRFLIRCVQFGVLIHLVWAIATAFIITLALGTTVEAPFGFLGLGYPERVTGVAGEPYFSWPFHLAIFLNRVLYVYAFYRLWRLFGAFANRHYFARKTIGHLHAFTGFFTLFTLSRISVSWLFVTTSAAQLPDGVTINIGFQDLADLGYPILFFIIAYILNEARKNEEELETYF